MTIGVFISASCLFPVAKVPNLPRRTQNIRWSIKNMKAYPTASLLKGEHQFQQKIKKQARHIFFSDLVCCQLKNFHKSQPNTCFFSDTFFFKLPKHHPSLMTSRWFLCPGPALLPMVVGQPQFRAVTVWAHGYLNLYRVLPSYNHLLGSNWHCLFSAGIYI